MGGNPHASKCGAILGLIAAALVFAGFLTPQWIDMPCKSGTSYLSPAQACCSSCSTTVSGGPSDCKNQPAGQEGCAWYTSNPGFNLSDNLKISEALGAICCGVVVLAVISHLVSFAKEGCTLITGIFYILTVTTGAFCVGVFCLDGDIKQDLSNGASYGYSFQIFIAGWGLAAVAELVTAGL